MSELRFDERVVVVTGAGNGLGRSHALLFAARGARVVVNDLGGDIHGAGSGRAADVVVDAIRERGGEAVASYDSVTEGAKIVETAMDAFGRGDVVVNNAGILRDASFHKMSDTDFEAILDVHVRGAYAVTRAAWPHMRDARYGRVLFTASAAGIYGNFGQANYALAKLGLHGMAQTLAIEGRKRGIQVNTIAPIAASRMTEAVFPEALFEALDPAYVSPLVAWLAHERCEVSGELFEVGGGHFARLRWERSTGKTFRLGRAITPDDVEASWGAIANMEATEHPADVAASLRPIIANLDRGTSRGGNAFIDVDEALGYEFPEQTSSYDEHDLALYALGVGAARDAEGELDLVFEMSKDGFKALPSYGVLPAVGVLLELGKQGVSAPGLNYGLDRILHGETKLTLTRPLPRKATLTHKARSKDIFDKGKGALVVQEIRSYDEDGDLLLINEVTTYVRGAGGWGGERGPSTERNPIPERAPDAVIEEPTAANQALLYRLSGDWNPLHADPDFARALRFERPILHGLCTFGFATRQVLGALAPEGDPRFLESIEVRFAESVYPGETLVTEAWKEGRRILFRTKVKERDAVVLSNAALTRFETLPEKRAPKVPAEVEEAPAAPAGPRAADFFRGIGLYVERHTEETRRIDEVFQFRLLSPDSVWTVDCKEGRVAPGETAKPSCTLEMDDAHFVAMAQGSADPTKLYFAGDLRITGNVMASQKLSALLSRVDARFVEEARARGGETRAASPVVEAAETEGPANAAPAFAPGLFAGLRLPGGGTARIQVRVTDPDGAWLVDLGSGSIQGGTYEGADTTLTLDDTSLKALADGSSDAAALFQRGKLRVDGDFAPARDLSWLAGTEGR
mgnify:CR=1 FL=1